MTEESLRKKLDEIEKREQKIDNELSVLDEFYRATKSEESYSRLRSILSNTERQRNLSLLSSTTTTTSGDNSASFLFSKKEQTNQQQQEMENFMEKRKHNSTNNNNNNPNSISSSSNNMENFVFGEGKEARQNLLNASNHLLFVQRTANLKSTMY